MEKDELTEEQLENVVAMPIPSEKLPDKFKQFANRKQDELNPEVTQVEETQNNELSLDELSMDELSKVYGGPVKTEQLPEDFYTENERKL